jgi:glutamate-ammonia-ligase adenylyltransferase
VWDELVPAFEAAGWITDGEVSPEAAELLRRLRRGPEPQPGLERIATLVADDPALSASVLANPALGDALVAIAGASPALTRTLRKHPGWLRPAGSTPVPLDADGDPWLAAMRQSARRRLLQIAADDLLGISDMPTVGAALADLADEASAVTLSALEAELAGRPEFTEIPRVPFTVIAMGKWGGRELNYASDVDVLFVHEVPDGSDSAAASSYASRLAGSYMRALGAPGPDPLVFRVDADLRPEGSSGPLSRSLDAFAAYYDRWAETWEFQALLKARPAAGDPDLGRRFMALVEPFVYPESLDPEAVRSIRVMKGRSEEHTIRGGRSELEIKRGTGGIRDVEFAVQLLQLVHGRRDPELRSRSTLTTLAALGAGGYVRPDDAADLGEAYRWLRDLEHRIQLYELRQTHELPADPAARERVAKSMRYRDEPDRSAVDAFEFDLVRHRALVRTIHERLFYRPMLEAYAAAPAAQLSDERLARQLTALGFRDIDGATRAFAELTTGLSRRSRLMQQLLPLMLDWLSQSPDPDLGLAQLRNLVTTTPDNARLVAELRDNPVAAERLCRLLGTSRLLGSLIDQIPDSLAVLGNDDLLERVPDRSERIVEARRAIAVRSERRARLGELRRLSRRHLLRTAFRDLLDMGTVGDVGCELSDTADAVAEAALDVAWEALDDPPPFTFSIIAMGKWGGRELQYPSDLDLLFVYHAVGRNDEASMAALQLAGEFLEAVGGVTPEGIAFVVDPDLRPEGRSGPLARSLEAYAQYYDRWADTWEFQALTKARLAAGDPDLGAEFMAMAQPRAFPARLSDEAARSIRTMKARIERERIPVGEDPAFHLKLGHGSLGDVEFTTQLLQMLHGGADPGLRIPGTIAAIDAMRGADLLDTDEAERLAESYRFCSRIRNRLYLQAGKAGDSLPTDPDELTRLGRSLGYEVNPRGVLRETYRRVTRRARRVVDRRFYQV